MTRKESKAGTKAAMVIERETSPTSFIDVLDRVLDKGIVIDAWMRVSLGGIQLFNVDSRMFVASIETYLKYTDVLGDTPLVLSGLRSNAKGEMLPISYHEHL